MKAQRTHWENCWKDPTHPECALAKIADLQEELDGGNAAYRTVIEERCFPDEQHCTCVPHLREHIARLKHEVGEYTDKLSASQAECAALREALDTIRMHTCGDMEDEGSFALVNRSELDNAMRALSRTPGSTDALWEFGVRVAHAAIGPRPTRRADDGGEYYLTDDEWHSAIVDRILGRAGSGRTT
jgi:hypothetical protein